jgi:hypothetical protein
MKRKRLDAGGFSHDLLIVAFVVIFMLVGAAYLVATHAATCGNPVSGVVSGVSAPASGSVSQPASGSCPVSSPVSAPVSSPAPTSFGTYMTVSSTAITNYLSRGNPNNVSGKPILGTGFTITAKQAASFELYNNTSSQGFGFYASSGNLQKGQTLTVNTYANPSLANNTYTGSYTLKYLNAATNTWQDGPTIKYAIDLVNNYYTDYLTMSSLSPVVTIHRNQQKPNSKGLFITNGPILKATNSTSYALSPSLPSQGAGFYTNSGSLAAKQALTTQLYVNRLKANGTYRGTDTLRYETKTGAWLNGPTINYIITLAN